MRCKEREGSHDNTSKTAFYTPFAGHLTNNNNYNGGRKEGEGERGGSQSAINAIKRHFGVGGEGFRRGGCANGHFIACLGC